MKCNVAGCAVTYDARVGLDVERSERHTRRDPLKLARRYFTDQEVASLKGMPAGLHASHAL